MEERYWISRDDDAEEYFFGWIAYAGDDVEEGRKILQDLGIVAGEYNPITEYYENCIVSKKQLVFKLDPRFGEFVWSLWRKCEKGNIPIV